MTAMDAANRRADTLASAIEINRPVNLPKALRALERCGGVVREATDQEILDAKAKAGAGARLRAGERRDGRGAAQAGQEARSRGTRPWRAS